MHVPDGFLDARTAVAAGALSVAALAVAVRQAQAHLPPRKVPLMGLSAAFVFAAQMLNFPVAGGTSGHLIGGVLCSVLLGPAAAVLVLASVLIVQCFVFADGGVLALGANVFNMAVVSAVGGYYAYRAVARVLPGGDRGRLAAVTCAAWAGTVLAAVACAGELAMSGVVGWRAAFPAMAGLHMLIGVGEAVITTLVVYGIGRTRPELLGDGPAGGAPSRRGYVEFAAFGMILALGLAIFVAPFANPWPDGLERVAETLGFGGRARELFRAPVPDYEFPGLPSALATSVAGAIGTVVVFVLAVLMARVLVPARRASDDAAG